jgi:hypothetical protein
MPPFSSQAEDEWVRRATARCTEAARKIVTDGALPSGTPIGRLTDDEWGWVVCAVIFAWVSTRAQQAASEELDSEQTIRMTGYSPDPWDAGAVAAILPELAEIEGVDWSLPLSEWSPEAITTFLLSAFTLIHKATIARDLTSSVLTRRTAHAEARETNAAAGNPLLAPDELNDPLM